MIFAIALILYRQVKTLAQIEAKVREQTLVGGCQNWNCDFKIEQWQQDLEKLVSEPEVQSKSLLTASDINDRR